MAVSRDPGRCERAEVTVYLNADLTCDCIEHRFRLIATQDGFDSLVIINEDPSTARLYAHDVMWGGWLHHNERSDYTTIHVVWHPLRRGEHHEVCFLEYPPRDTSSSFRAITDKREHLIYRLIVPPDSIPQITVSAVNAWPPHLKELYRDFREILTPTNNGLYAREWKKVAIGYSYGISWLPMELLR